MWEVEKNYDNLMHFYINKSENKYFSRKTLDFTLQTRRKDEFNQDNHWKNKLNKVENTHKTFVYKNSSQIFI